MKPSKQIYLIDTSALYPLIRRLGTRIAYYIDQLVVLDLTIYEVGNTIWKEYRKGQIENLEDTVEMFSKILDNMKTISISPDEIEGVLEIALRNNITFYDASYIYASLKYSLKLVSEDEDIRGNYPQAIGVEQLIEQLGIEE